MFQKNDLIPLEITDITDEGNGVGKAEGFAFFVPGAAIGDRLVIRIVKLLKSYGYGIIHEIISPSPDRIEPDCPVYRQCGGCSLRHLSYEAELKIKENWVRQHLLRIGGLDVPLLPILPSPQASAYRNKAQFPVGTDKDGQVVIGLYGPRSHRIIPCLDCRLQPAFFSDILCVIQDFCREYRIPPYDEQSHRGLLRHIYIRHGEGTGETMVCLVCNGENFPHSDILCERLVARVPSVCSIVLNVNRRATNVILGESCRTLYGKGDICDTLCGVTLQISPLSFYQVNRRGAEQLYETAREMAGLRGDEVLLDLYCGTGAIGLSMAKHVKSLVGVEVIPQAVENARENARRSGIQNARFLCADAAQAASQLRQEGLSPDVIVLDPPRKGCSQEALEIVAGMGAQRLVMVSCNSATLARDLAILSQLGYRPIKARPVDMFPRTAHVECVVLLSKVQN